MSNPRSVSLQLLFVLLVSMTAAACGPTYLMDDNFHAEDLDFRIDDEAKIQDTSSHREVLEVLAKYRVAIVKKDFGTLNSIIASEYYENAGTTNTTKDDYGHPQLKDLFELMAQHSESIQYKITVKQIEVSKREAQVDYEYRYAYQYKVGEEMSWDAGVEVNRVQLRQMDGVWKIISGL